MKCNIKQHKPLTPYQLKKHNSEIQWQAFIYVLGLTAYSLECMGATKVQIQSVINCILNQYDCLIAGTVTMDDIHTYLADLGISFDKNELRSEKTEYDNQIELLKLSE